MATPWGPGWPSTHKIPHEEAGHPQISVPVPCTLHGTHGPGHPWCGAKLALLACYQHCLPLPWDGHFWGACAGVRVLVQPAEAWLCREDGIMVVYLQLRRDLMLMPEIHHFPTLLSLWILGLDCPLTPEIFKHGTERREGVHEDNAHRHKPHVCIGLIGSDKFCWTGFGLLLQSIMSKPILCLI